MVFDHTFHVDAPPDLLWTLIKNVPQLLEHIPGARFSGSAGALTHNATFTVAGGPARGTYGLQVAVDSLDDASRTAVVNVTGENTTGSGEVRATLRVAVQPLGLGSTIAVHADIDGPGIAASAAGAQASASGANAQGAPPPEFTDAANAFAANLQKMFQR